jgi:hypothetical protein
MNILSQPQNKCNFLKILFCRHSFINKIGVVNNRFDYVFYEQCKKCSKIKNIKDFHSPLIDNKSSFN